ncbi:hypothetical protein HPB51_016819 [Rhipicephalus microplus]|uniref:Transposase Tc1-like domain-containing protein n=1 Tax=Rhipicephalus microplus TaxID=6941 RepID=A0A9J6DIG3_RHIMP|nr:hypothetical protein HPB51_016819 [Rhipicephalus microplus]
MNVVEIEGETLSPEEYNDTQGWVVAQERRKKAKGKRNAEPATNAGGASMEASRRLKDVLHRRPVPKEPQLPEDDYKVVIRPGGGLDLTRQILALIRNCVLRAAKVQPDIAGEDTLRINMRQNTMILSTPSLANAKEYSNIKETMINNKSYATAAYVTAPENTSKGVIHGILNPSKDLDLDVSDPTIRRRLRTAGLRSRIAAQKPLLTAAHQDARRQIAELHEAWTSEEWGRVIFSDESTCST